MFEPNIIMNPESIGFQTLTLRRPWSKDIHWLFAKKIHKKDNSSSPTLTDGGETREWNSHQMSWYPLEPILLHLLSSFSVTKPQFSSAAITDILPGQRFSQEYVPHSKKSPLTDSQNHFWSVSKPKTAQGNRFPYQRMLQFTECKRNPLLNIHCLQQLSQRVGKV